MFHTNNSEIHVSQSIKDNSSNLNSATIIQETINDLEDKNVPESQIFNEDGSLSNEFKEYFTNEWTDIYFKSPIKYKRLFQDNPEKGYVKMIDLYNRNKRKINSSFKFSFHDENNILMRQIRKAAMFLQINEFFIMSNAERFDNPLPIFTKYDENHKRVSMSKLEIGEMISDWIEQRKSDWLRYEEAEYVAHGYSEHLTMRDCKAMIKYTYNACATPTNVIGYLSMTRKELLDFYEAMCYRYEFCVNYKGFNDKLGKKKAIIDNFKTILENKKFHFGTEGIFTRYGYSDKRCAYTSETLNKANETKQKNYDERYESYLKYCNNSTTTISEKLKICERTVESYKEKLILQACNFILEKEVVFNSDLEEKLCKEFKNSYNSNCLPKYIRTKLNRALNACKQ